ncbi:MAG: geranylgeranylglycerol-phosphate geranylgeranyltransferase [Bacteroidota bacterium]
MAWLRLIRWKNLLIIFITQLFAWCCVILPIQGYIPMPLLLNNKHFLYISISTVLIAAAGYIINDYFDIKIDAINRPENVILEQKIPRRIAIMLHTIFNVTGLGLAAIIAKQAGHYEWLAMQMGCTLLLWLYSTRFKRQFVIGNVVVAFLTSFTIITLMLYEPAMHYYFWRSHFLLSKSNGLIPNPVWVLGVYAYFAFMLTWIREIVKDMEDLKGDAEQGCVTMPIKWGLLRTSRFAQAIGVLALIPLIIASGKLMNTHWKPLGIYTLVALILPLTAWIKFLPTKATTQHYNQASRGLKIIMVLGVGSLIIYYLQAHA